MQIEIAWPMTNFAQVRVVAAGPDLVFHFKTPRAAVGQPPTPPGTLGGGGGNIKAAEFNGPTFPRVGGLYLDAACTQLVPLSAYGGGTSNTIAPSLNFYGSPQTSDHGKPKDVVVLQPNTDYYWVVNADPAMGNPPSGMNTVCDFTPCNPKH